ncbi:EamA family transporter [Patescibacteria group bacterium]|nr:EamA family transporter [Patescibacteria group bacterium]
MLWLIVAISSYFLFAAVALVDKYLLGGLIPSPKVYVFYVGIFGILALVLIPFGFLIPAPSQILLALSVGAFHILGVFAYFNGLKNFEASRVIPAIGGLAPLFTLGLTYLLLGENETLSFIEITAFILLILGSILISWEKSKNITLKSLQISALAAFLFSLYYVLAKLVYLEQPFISGFIWTRLGAFLIAIIFLFSKEVQEEIFVKRKTFKLKTWGIFLPNVAAAGGAFFLQNWAIALAGVTYVAVISALIGVQYVFLLFFAIVISLKFPKVLKEDISKKTIFQKTFAVLLLGAGLAILACT